MFYLNQIFILIIFLKISVSFQSRLKHLYSTRVQGNSEIDLDLNYILTQKLIEDPNFEIIINFDIDYSNSPDFQLGFGQILENDNQDYESYQKIETYNQYQERKNDFFSDFDAFNAKSVNQTFIIKQEELPQLNEDGKYDAKLRLQILQVQISSIKQNSKKFNLNSLENWVYIYYRKYEDLDNCPIDCSGNGVCDRGNCVCFVQPEEMYLGQYCEQHTYTVGTFKEISSSMNGYSTRFVTIQIEQQRPMDQNLLIKFDKFPNNVSLLVSSYRRYVDTKNQQNQIPGFVETKFQKILKIDDDKLPYYQLTVDQLKDVKKQDDREIIIGFLNLSPDPIQFSAQIIFSNEHAYDDGLPIEAKIIIYIFVGIVLIILIAITYTFCQKSSDQKNQVQQQPPDSVQQRQLAGVQSARNIQNLQSSSLIQNQMQGPNNMSRSKKKKILKLTQEIIDEFFPEQNIEEIRQEINNDYPELDHEMQECAVCLMEFEQDEKCRMTLCLHTFHSECLVSWLKKNENCPVCRYVLNRKALLEYMQEEEQRQSTQQLDSIQNSKKDKSQDIQSISSRQQQKSDRDSINTNKDQQNMNQKMLSIDNMEEQKVEISSQIEIEKSEKKILSNQIKIENLKSEENYKQLDNQLNTEILSQNNINISKDASPSKKQQFIDNLNMSYSRNRNISNFDVIDDQQSPQKIFGNGRIFQNQLNSSLNGSNQVQLTGMSNDRFMDLNNQTHLTTNPDQMAFSDQKMVNSKNFSNKKGKRQQIQTNFKQNLNLDHSPSPLTPNQQKYLSNEIQSIREEGYSLNHSFNKQANQDNNYVFKKKSLDDNTNDKDQQQYDQTSQITNILSGFSNIGGNQELDNLNKMESSKKIKEEQYQKEQKDLQQKKLALQQKRSKLAQKHKNNNNKKSSDE